MEIILQSPLDMHLHLREAEMLKLVAPLSADHFAGAVIMPNLINPITDLEAVKNYRKDILAYCPARNFIPYMTLFFKDYSFEELKYAKEDIVGIKLYPAGITTQSESGVSDFEKISETLGYMQELNIPLLVHGETNGFVMDREYEFLEKYRWIASSFPKLTVIMEHITTAASIKLLEEFDNLFATVTLHHLLITLDDVAGGLLQPDLFCKPIAKTPIDKEALQKAIFAGNSKIMFGSDSAPHPRHKKECCGCAAGIFSAPVALAMLAELFEKNLCLDKLQNFISGFAQRIYKISPVPKNVLLKKQPWQVPENFGDVKPFHAGETLEWQASQVL